MEPQTWAGHQDGLLDEIEELLKELGDEEDELDRLLATGLFTGHRAAHGADGEA